MSIKLGSEHQRHTPPAENCLIYPLIGVNSQIRAMSIRFRKNSRNKPHLCVTEPFPAKSSSKSLTIQHCSGYVSKNPFGMCPTISDASPDAHLIGFVSDIKRVRQTAR